MQFAERSGRRIRRSMDFAYCNDIVIKRLPEYFAVVGAMRPDAVWTAAFRAKKAFANGRLRAGGAVRPKPKMLTCDAFAFRRRTRAFFNDQKRRVHCRVVPGVGFSLDRQRRRVRHRRKACAASFLH